MNELAGLHRMLGQRHSSNDPVRNDPAPHRGPTLLTAAAVAGSPIAPGPCAVWARTEGIGLGDTVVLLVTDAAEAAALRQGLAWVGARTRDLEPGCGEHELALVLSTAAAAIVDSHLAPTYSRALGRLERLPAVWWNGAGADFARIDLALAEIAEAEALAAAALC